MFGAAALETRSLGNRNRNQNRKGPEDTEDVSTPVPGARLTAAPDC